MLGATSIVTWIAAIGLLGLMSPHVAYAQGGAPPRDGFRYYIPGACVEAVKRSDAFYWRTTPDTVQFNMAADTMLTVSARLAKACAAQFSVEQVNPRDLVLLAKVYLAAGDDPAALRAVTRRLHEDADASAATRAATLEDIVGAYLHASPARLHEAQRYLAQLDTVSGSEAALSRFRAHLSMLRYFEMANDDANLRAQAEAAIVADKEMNAKDRREFGVYIGEVYKILAAAEGARTGTSAAPRAVIERAREDVKSLSYGIAMMAKPDTIASLYGRKGTRVKGDYWLGATGDTIRPAPGKVTIIVFRLNRTSVAALRRLQERFGDQIAVTGLVHTVGYFRDEGPLNTDQELKLLRQYYIDELGMPGTIAVSKTQFTTMPDGRRRAPLDSTSRAYWTPAGTVAVVLDQQGIIRRVFTDSWKPWFENRIAEFIESTP
jgi:hypothetical protein